MTDFRFHCVCVQTRARHYGDMVEWCQEQFPSRGNGPRWGQMVSDGLVTFWFSTEEDLVQFKLTWL